MNDTLVSQIELLAWTYNEGEEISVLLYHGETQVGVCDSHSGNAGPGEGSAETLSCDELVTANRVKLTFTSRPESELFTDEIKVTGVVTGKSDL